MIRTRLEMTEAEFRTRGGMLDKLMEVVFDSCILLDAEGIMIHATHNADGFEQTPPNVQIGKHISEVNPYAHFAMDTLKTHKGHWGVTEVVQERKCLMNIFPIFCGNKFIGVLGTITYSSLESLGKIIAQLQDSPYMKDSGKVFNALAKVGNNRTFHDFIGESPQVAMVIEKCRRAASSHLPVLVLGESGTGKEILANAIHSATVDRTWNPFVRLNCSAIPKDLIESEFFGHEKGAFTGASAMKKGKFELASGGSILLDEIGDMDYNLQSKLLRVLEEKEFERVGGTTMLPMTARIISSTNSDLHRKSREETFRSDLYYRLSAIEIEVPPLRERPEDIPLLVEHYVHKDELDIAVDRSAIKELAAYHWPGNVRELRNVLNRLGLFQPNETVSASDIRPYLQEEHPDQQMLTPQPITGRTSHKAQDSVEKAHLIDVLMSTDFRVSEAAEKLGVCRATVYNMMNRHGIKRKTYVG